MTEKTIYFPGLNGLRFFAALVVIIHHTEQIKGIFKMPNHFYLPFVNIIGGLGVTLFFVLSGFLITYLLLQEKKEFANINLRKFYMRRILRIWPLYYLIVILGFFVLPHIIHIKDFPSVLDSNFYIKLFLFICLVPNISLQFFNVVPFIAPLWSVGVEEQFYLGWPIIIKFSKIKLISILIFMILSIGFLRFILPFSHNAVVLKAGNFLEYFRVDCMAVGGSFAYLLSEKKEKLLKFFYNKFLQIINYLLLALFLLKGISFPFFQTVYAIMFGLLILNISSNSNSIIKLEGKIFNWLGKISYGLYVFHGSIIFLVLYYFKNLVLSFENSYLGDGVIYLLIFLFTILISYLSYHFYEKRFLKQKQKYTLIKSGSI